MARRARRCRYGRVKSGARKGLCRKARGRRNPCKGETGVFYRQCMQRTSMARARRILG